MKGAHTLCLRNRQALILGFQSIEGIFFYEDIKGIENPFLAIKEQETDQEGFPFRIKSG